MTSKSETMDGKSLNLSNLISWLFAILFIAVGLVNTFWGNDPGFGIFLLTIAFVYFPPATQFVKERTGLSLNPILKVLLAAFVVIAVLGVGELFDKIDMMIVDLGLH